MTLMLSFIALIVLAAMVWVAVGLVRPRSNVADRLEDLDRLSKLREAGTITESEYESLKRKKLRR